MGIFLCKTPVRDRERRSSWIAVPNDLGTVFPKNVAQDVLSFLVYYEKYDTFNINITHTDHFEFREGKRTSLVWLGNSLLPMQAMPSVSETDISNIASSPYYPDWETYRRNFTNRSHESLSSFYTLHDNASYSSLSSLVAPDLLKLCDKNTQSSKTSDAVLPPFKKRMLQLQTSEDDLKDVPSVPVKLTANRSRKLNFVDDNRVETPGFGHILTATTEHHPETAAPYLALRDMNPNSLKHLDKHSLMDQAHDKMVKVVRVKQRHKMVKQSSGSQVSDSSSYTQYSDLHFAGASDFYNSLSEADSSLSDPNLLPSIISIRDIHSGTLESSV